MKHLPQLGDGCVHFGYCGFYIAITGQLQVEFLVADMAIFIGIKVGQHCICSQARLYRLI
jgi:hypothetical protein